MEDFTSASQRTLKFLHERFGLGLWMVTRVENDNWIILSAEDHKYGVKAGEVLKWSESFCARMVAGAGPNFAPDADAVPAYRDAPIGRKHKIGAYIGLPIKNGDGSLFGTLCAISPEKQSPELDLQMDHVRMLVDLLSCLLDAELKSVQAVRRFERAVDAARTDYLTSIYNRRGWAEFMQREEDRCRRYGHPACVISIDLDGLKEINDRQGHAAGDALLTAAASTLASAIRSTDIVARMGGDEFAILCVESDLAATLVVADRVRQALAEKNIAASIGMAMRRPDTGLLLTVDAADQSMYEDKRRKRMAGYKRSGTFG